MTSINYKFPDKNNKNKNNMLCYILIKTFVDFVVN